MFTASNGNIYFGVIIFGVKDLAQLANFYFNRDSPGSVVAHTIDEQFMEGKEFMQAPVVPFGKIKDRYPPSNYAMFIPMTHREMGALRRRKYAEAKAMGYDLCNYISPSATVYPGSVLGDNNFIFEDNTIQPFAKIGSNNILWSGNHIGHHSVIKDDVFITSHVVVSGHVTIENRCYLGVNSTIRDGVTLNAGTLVGMGAVIGKDTQRFGVYTNPNTKARDAVESIELL